MIVNSDLPLVVRRAADFVQTVAVGGGVSYGVQIVLICWVTTAGRSR